MTSDRALFASIVFLALGLGLIFGYCHDSTVGFSGALPASGASLQIVINTNGWPAIAGTAATVLGVVLLLAAAVLAILKQNSQTQVATRVGGSVS